MKSYVFLALLYTILNLNIYSQNTASKQVTFFTIEAPQLNTNKMIWIFLPKSYQNSQKAYPVFYMHDAQNLFDDKTSFVGEWKVDEYLDTISTNEVIVVGIEHGNEKRIDELTPFPHEKYGGGKGNDYIEFIRYTLKPNIDATYRTLPDRNNTTIFGSSLGGLISFYAIMKYPDTFGKAGIFSPAFWINEEIYKMVDLMKEKKEMKLFFLVGTEESETAVSDQQKMVDLLIQKGLDKTNIINKIVKGGKHSESFWSVHFAEAHKWLLEDSN